MKKTFFLLAIILFNLGLFEFILGMFDPEQILVKGFDKKLLFRMYPDKTGKVVSEEYAVLVETNQNGFRQKIDSNHKYSTLLIGDSFTEGWGVEADEIYSEILNQSSKEEKFLNLGLHGSSPILFALQMKYYLETFKPKKVIVQLFDNDLDDNDKIEIFTELDKEGKVVSPKQRLGASIFGESIYNFFKERTLYRLTTKVVKFFQKQPSPILYYKVGREPKVKTLSHEESIQKFGKLSPLGKDINVKYGNQFGFYKDAEEELWKSRLRKNEIYLNQILDICKQNNVELSFLYIPAKEFFAKGGITGALKDFSSEAHSQKNPHYQQIQKVCKENQLKCYFTNEYFFDKDPEKLYFPYDAHLNKEGHRVLAEMILEKGN
ncbi:MAG TPA: GDSL family lipase [Leptospiraceae bacterium]|nr:GDSL family lipase [Leptospiraceae bacterium]HMW05053.1 GDSL family lipase [Leptospiraceae bacterium]HMX31497.1 GDSL family lipase [Leptospiraceae bacterium]HMY31650.1 GDSL family lipase [Leptospiraceae bacterium]HMZ62606.1 GDSL family lipase [Leptospiraceae bacterium]